jgi:hypothetical protein
MKSKIKIRKKIKSKSKIKSKRGAWSWLDAVRGA